MLRRPSFRIAAAAALAMLAGTAVADPLTTAFTYQGRLLQGGNAPTALYDFQFTLFDAVSGGAVQGSTVTLGSVPVSSGLFTVNLDFGAQYTGSRHFLQIAVRSAGAGGYTSLSPRQELTATPGAQAVVLPMNESASANLGALVAITNNGAGEGFSASTSGGSINGGGVVSTAAGLNSNGVVGIATNGPGAFGVWGQAPVGIGVVGNGGEYGGSFAGPVGMYGGANGTGLSGIGVQGSGGTTGFIGVRGDSVTGSGNSDGVLGVSTDPSGNGVRGEADGGIYAYGVWGYTTSGVGVAGNGVASGGNFTGNTGVVGSSILAGASGVGVLGLGSTGNIGVEGQASNGGTSSFGGYFTSSAAGGNGLYAEDSVGTSAYGIWGVSSTGNAGQFTGNVSISGDLWVNGAKHFKIDHPLDPANYYLVHACVESDQQINIYKGHVILDGAGRADIQLPSYFQALNTDAEYHLTPIGAPAPSLYVAKKVENNHFAIAGGTPGQEISWQVMGVRQDAYTLAHPMVVEQAKVGDERGRYTHPELFGLPESFDVAAEKLAAVRAHGAAPIPPAAFPKAAQSAVPAPAAPLMKGGN
jgi:hypothetical protein